MEYSGVPGPQIAPMFFSRTFSGTPNTVEVPDLAGTGEHLLCDPAKVGYCPNDYAAGY